MIKGIIFDLGHTLLGNSRGWQELAQEGAEAMAEWYFKKKRIKIDTLALIETFLAERSAARKVAEQTHVEVLAEQSLSLALEKIEAPPKARAKATLEAALKIFFEPEQAAWQLYPDTIDTLKLLKRQGYQLGLYSNATDDPLIQRLVNMRRLRPLLAPSFSSAGYGWRKPNPELFQLIARRWGLPPAEIVVVGDTLNADILGAQNAGMFSILVTMRESPSNANHRHIKPTTTAERLADLPEIISRLSRSKFEEAASSDAVTPGI